MRSKTSLQKLFLFGKNQQFFQAVLIVHMLNLMK